MLQRLLADLHLNFLTDHPSYKDIGKVLSMVEAAAVSLAIGKHEPGASVSIALAVNETGPNASRQIALTWRKVSERVSRLHADLERRTQLAAEATGLLFAVAAWESVAVEESVKANGWDYRLVSREAGGAMYAAHDDSIALELSGIDADSHSETPAGRVARKRRRLVEQYPRSLPAVVIVTDFRVPEILVTYVPTII